MNLGEFFVSDFLLHTLWYKIAGKKPHRVFLRTTRNETLSQNAHLEGGVKIIGLFKFCFLTILCVLIGQLLPQFARAAVIRSLGPTKALIVFGDDDGFKVGDTIYAYFPDGSKKATLQITTVRNRQAIAEVKNGQPEEGDAVRLPPTKYGPGAKTAGRGAPAFWADYGFLNLTGGVSLVSQSVKLTDATSVSLSGLSPFLRASISNAWPKHEGFVWDLGASLDLLKTTGTIATPVCNGTRNCEMNLMGLTPSARAGYQLAPKFLDLQFRGGTDFFVPVQASSNVVDSSAFKPLVFISLGLFAQKKWGEDSAVPFTFDYSFYVGDQNVKITKLMFSTGFSWR